MKDRAAIADVLYIGLLFGGPTCLLLADWALGGIFADLLSPVLSREVLLGAVPKLSNDFDAIAEYHFSYAPDPYLYWYLAALIYASFAGCLGSLYALAASRRPARAATISKQMPNRWWKWLLFGVGVVVVLLWPWFGPSLLATPDGPDRAFPPGSVHAFLMSLMLAMYAAAVAATPALIRIAFALRTSKGES